MALSPCPSHPSQGQEPLPSPRVTRKVQAVQAPALCAPRCRAGHAAGTHLHKQKKGVHGSHPRARHVSWLTSEGQLCNPHRSFQNPACPPPPAGWVSPCGTLGGSCAPACGGCPGPAGSRPVRRRTRGTSHPGPGWLLPAFARVPSSATAAGHRSAAGPPVGRATREETGDWPMAGAEIPAGIRPSPAQPSAAAAQGESGESQRGEPGKRSTDSKRADEGQTRAHSV